MAKIGEEKNIGVRRLGQRSDRTSSLPHKNKPKKKDVVKKAVEEVIEEDTQLRESVEEIKPKIKKYKPRRPRKKEDIIRQIEEDNNE